MEVESDPTNNTTDDNNATAAVPSVDKGKAGRTDYAQWDRLATDLVQEVSKEEEEEKEVAEAALGLDGKYAVSQADAEEREKLKRALETKKKLDAFRERDASLVQTLTNLMGEEALNKQKKHPTIIRLTRNEVEEGKRVLAICDTAGASTNDQIILTDDLSKLESAMPINQKAKSFPEDAENTPVPEEGSEETGESKPVYGIIKLDLFSLRDCCVVVECKVISGTVEIHNCSNVTIRFESSTATVFTVQADLSDRITLEWYDAEKEPRIYHAGVRDMKIRMHTKLGGLRMETEADYIRDGAKAVGTATPEEYRFVTQLVEGKWSTEHVVQAGPRSMTARELAIEKERRKKAEKQALEQAESMIQIKDKDGNPLASKNEAAETKEEEEVPKSEEELIEEVMSDALKHQVEDCEMEKNKGNDSFKAGEYAQAILHYSLALDKAQQLGKHLGPPRDVLYSNRSACFLKMGDHERALADAAKALKINPDNLKAQFREGLALHALKRYEEALPKLVAANKKEPHNKQIKQALQFCEVRLEQEYRKRMQGE